jgi:hypothetical protein
MGNHLTKKYFDKVVQDMSIYMGWKPKVWNEDRTMNVGAVFVDYYKYGGGYRLCRISSPTGGEQTMGPHGRMSAKEFDAWLKGVQWAMGYASSMQALKKPIDVPCNSTWPDMWVGAGHAKDVQGEA